MVRLKAQNNKILDNKKKIKKWEKYREIDILSSFSCLRESHS